MQLDLFEVWKPVEGYPNYEVSNTGMVRNINYRRTGYARKLKPSADKTPVEVYNFTTGAYLSTEESQLEASRRYKIPQGNIGSIVRGERKQVKGYTFKRAEA